MNENQNSDADTLLQAGKFLVDMTGDCPLGMELWHPEDNPKGDCASVCCGDIEPQCWINYLRLRSQGKIQSTAPWTG